MANHLDITRHGRNYRFYLQLLSAIAKLPDVLAYSLSSKLATHVFSPIQQNEKNIRQAMIDANIAVDDWHDLWRQYLTNHAYFCLNTFQHASLDKQWLQNNVDVDMALLNQIKQENKGALFLTYHHAYQHTLFCALGLAGFRTQVLATAEDSTILFPFIGHYIRKLHRDCAIHFNGGDYLFFEKNIRGVRLAKQALQNGDLLVSLNDFATTGNSTLYPLFNRSVPAPSGSVQLACRMKLPIILGIMHRHGNRYRINLRKVESNHDPDIVMQSYFSFLSENLKITPGIWEGWNWFSTLPPHTNTSSITHP